MLSPIRHLTALSALLLAGCGSTPAPLPSCDTPGVRVCANRLGMALVRIPAGTFWMGSDESPAALACDFPAADAEWAYACRAGADNTRYAHGNDPQGLVRHANNVFDTSAARLWPQWRPHALQGDDGHTFTAPVGHYPPNAFGLHDLHGNAWEWTADWHADDDYAQSPVDDPQGPATGGVRVRRGGSWHTWPLYARCGFRNWNSPETRYPLVGVRLVMELEPGR